MNAEWKSFSSMPSVLFSWSWKFQGRSTQIFSRDLMLLRCCWVAVPHQGNNLVSWMRQDGSPDSTSGWQLLISRPPLSHAAFSVRIIAVQEGRNWLRVLPQCPSGFLSGVWHSRGVTFEIGSPTKTQFSVLPVWPFSPYSSTQHTAIDQENSSKYPKCGVWTTNSKSVSFDIFAWNLVENPMRLQFKKVLINF